MSLQAGPMRHRITIQAYTKSADPFTTPDSWTNVVTMWSRIQPISAKEVYQAGQLNMKASHTITIRYPGKNFSVSAGDRVLYGNRVFNLLTGIINSDERNISLVLTAFEIDPTQ